MAKTARTQNLDSLRDGCDRHWQLKQAKAEIRILDVLSSRGLTVLEIVDRTGLSRNGVSLALERLKGVCVKKRLAKWYLIP